MHFLWFVIILANTFSVFASSRLQFSLPKEDLLQDIYESDSVSPQTNNGKELESLESAESAEKLRTALRALLRLNDGELESIMKGVSLEDIKDSLSPATAFILQASKSRFQRIKALIADRSKDQKLPGDMQIARRNKNSQALQSETLEERNFEASGDSDSLFGALADLSDSLQKNQKNQGKRSRKHKRHSYHSSSTERKIHYTYWMKPEECPRNAEGFPQVHCPNPTEDLKWVCVEDRDLCDGFSHCPHHEDEDPMACLYFKTMQNYVDTLISALLESRRS